MDVTTDRQREAILLLSGGLDSATVLAIALAEGFALHTLSFRYGQRHARELHAARLIAKRPGVLSHRVAEVDLGAIGGSALTTPTPVPKGRTPNDMAATIPVTYVPARNTIFLSYALALAEVLGVWDIFIGVNALDYSGYPDCRPEYIAAFERLANLATRAGVEGDHGFRIHTPLLQMTKGEIVRRGLALGVDYSITHSCYDPSDEGLACGTCDACQLRLKGFAEVGVPDPIPYQGAGPYSP